MGCGLPAGAQTPLILSVRQAQRKKLRSKLPREIVESLQQRAVPPDEERLCQGREGYRKFSIGEESCFLENRTGSL